MNLVLRKPTHSTSPGSPLGSTDQRKSHYRGEVILSTVATLRIYDRLQVHQIRPARESSTYYPRPVTVPGLCKFPVHWWTGPPKNKFPVKSQIH